MEQNYYKLTESSGWRDFAGCLGVFLFALFIMLFFFAAGLMFGMGQARAHQAKSGWTYPPGCCDKPSRECHEIPGERVTKLTGGRYKVYLFPGDHPNVLSPVELIPNHIHSSGDGEYHACVSENGQAMYCLFIPLSSQLDLNLYARLPNKKEQ